MYLKLVFLISIIKNLIYIAISFVNNIKAILKVSVLLALTIFFL